jgi:methyl-accepting chemotaxis protein
MGLFDMFKDKAAELIQGVKEQVSEATGIDLQPDTVVDQIGKAAGSVTEAGQNLAAAVDLQPDVVVDQVGQAAGSVTEASQNLAATAEGAVKDATDPLGGN